MNKREENQNIYNKNENDPLTEDKYAMKLNMCVGPLTSTSIYGYIFWDVNAQIKLFNFEFTHK